MLDPLSAFVFATLFSLLNGAVLGFIHPALTPDLQPSSADWRVGTLLVAGGSALFIGQAATGANWVLPLANGAWLVGLALYWRAVRRLFAVPDSHWIYLPVLAGTFGNVVFVYAVPSVAYRVAVATVCWVAIIGGAVATLLRHRDRDRSISARVLTGIFILLAALMVPQQVTIVPNYLTVANVFGHNWINTYQGIVIPGASVAVGTFLLRQAFLSLPREVLDAAKVDGANHLQLLWQIVLPMAKPVLVTFGLISLVAKWNDYLWPLIVTNEDRMRTLSVGISYLYNPESTVRWGPLLAGTFFVIAPLILIYLWAQKHIIDGITAGATKS